MLNEVNLIGMLGGDPESTEVNGNTKVSFSLATSESYKDKSGEKQTSTEWHNIEVWGKPGEICKQYLGKGSKVYIKGSIKTQKWEDTNGVKRQKTIIRAKEFKFLDSKSSQ